MKFFSYLVVSMYLALNTSYAVLPGLQRTLEIIKGENIKSAVEIIKKLMNVEVDGGRNYSMPGLEDNKKYAKILLKFILTGKLDNDKGETFYQTHISKRHFAIEEERDILSTAIMKTACIDLSLAHFIEEVIAQEKEPYAKRHQKVVQQLFHLTSLIIREPFLYDLSSFIHSNIEFRSFDYDDIKDDPHFKGINCKKFNAVLKKNKIWMDHALRLLDGDRGIQKEILCNNLTKNVKRPVTDNLGKAAEKKVATDKDPISPEENYDYQQFLASKVGGVEINPDSWRNIVNSSYPIQGWKIHVSATVHGATRVAKVVVPYLKENNIASKIAGSLAFLQSLDYYSDSLGIAQRGKFITIYPGRDNHGAGNNKNAAKIARDLNDLLMDAVKSGEILKNDFKVIPYDARLGESGGLYVRYGILSNAIYVKPVDSDGNMVEGKWTFDNRQGHYKPDFVTWNPFGDLLHEPQGY